MQDSEIDLDEIVAQANALTSETPSDLPSRYKAVEDTFYNQARSMQQLLTDTIGTDHIRDVRMMAAACKDIMNNYNETCRLRKLAEIECGRVVPMRVLEQYQRDILPAIANGIDNLRMEVTNILQPQERASFQAAWNAAYPKFVSMLGEAASKLQGYIEEAKREATGNAPTKKERAKNTAISKEKKAQSAKLRYTRERNMR